MVNVVVNLEGVSLRGIALVCHVVVPHPYIPLMPVLNNPK